MGFDHWYGLTTALKASNPITKQLNLKQLIDWHRLDVTIAYVLGVALHTSRFRCIPDSGACVVHAGADEGLGFETAKFLLSHKHPVIVAAKTKSKGAAKMYHIRINVVDPAIFQTTFGSSSFHVFGHPTF